MYSENENTGGITNVNEVESGVLRGRLKKITMVYSLI
jgi:hypothetical protein